MNQLPLRLLSILMTAWTGWVFGWLLAVGLTAPYGLLSNIVVPIAQLAFALGAVVLLSRRGVVGTLSRAQLLSRGVGLVVLSSWGSVLSLAIAQGGFDRISPWLTPIVALLLAALYLLAVALIIEQVTIAVKWRWLAIGGSLILLTLLPVGFEWISRIFGYQPTKTTHLRRTQNRSLTLSQTRLRKLDLRPASRPSSSPHA